MGCNGRTFEELPPDWNCDVRVGCKGLQWEDFSGITPWLKWPCKSGLQWAAIGWIFRNYPPHWNCHVRVGCNGLQWEEFSEIKPPDWNCHVRVGCNGLQWEDFSGITPPPDWSWEGENDARVALPRGVKWCKGEGVICSEGENEVRVGLSRG